MFFQTNVLFPANNFLRAIVIEKHYRGIVSRQVAEQFWDEVQKVAPFFAEMAPVIATAKYYLIHILRGWYTFNDCRNFVKSDRIQEDCFSLP